MRKLTMDVGGTIMVKRLRLTRGTGQGRSPLHSLRFGDSNVSRGPRHVALASLLPGQSATIVSLPADHQLLRRLASYGLLPGVEVMVEWRIPAFIITIGATRIALDRQTAALITVQARDL